METKIISGWRRQLSQAGIPESRLAERAGISVQYLSDILAGNRSGVTVQARLEAALQELLAEAAARQR